MPSEGNVPMIERVPAPRPPSRAAIYPLPPPGTRGEESIVPLVRAGRQEPAAPIASVPSPAPRDRDFAAVVSPITLATLQALLRSGSLQRRDRRYRGAIASRSWPL
jgi:hypothetical protein